MDDQEKDKRLPRREALTLPVKLTGAELKQRGLELAATFGDLRGIEAEKKEIAAKYKAQEEEKRSALKKISTAISSGYEPRSVDCRIDLVGDEVVTTRLDSKEVVCRRPATKEDRQQWLFSEPTETVS